MPSRKGEPKLASCSPSDVFRALQKLGGFSFYNGAKHTKVIHLDSGKSSTIPRHSVINRHLMKGFVEEFLVQDIGLSKENIYQYLWC